MPAAVSVSTRPSTTTLPWSGAISPATAFTIVVLPEPERPNNAVTPAGATKDASSAKPGKR